MKKIKYTKDLAKIIGDETNGTIVYVKENRSYYKWIGGINPSDGYNYISSYGGTWNRISGDFENKIFKYINTPNKTFDVNFKMLPNAGWRPLTFIIRISMDGEANEFNNYYSAEVKYSYYYNSGASNKVIITENSDGITMTESYDINTHILTFTFEITQTSERYIVAAAYIDMFGGGTGNMIK